MIDDFRFIHNPTLVKKNKANKAINQILLIPHDSYLEGIYMLGHLSAERQAHMLSYTNPSLKSFLNFMSTHEDYFLRNKKEPSIELIMVVMLIESYP